MENDTDELFIVVKNDGKQGTSKAKTESKPRKTNMEKINAILAEKGLVGDIQENALGPVLNKPDRFKF